MVFIAGFFWGGGGLLRFFFQEQENWDIFPVSTIDPDSSQGISKNFIWVRKSEGKNPAVAKFQFW